MNIIYPENVFFKGLKSIILYDSFLTSKLFRVDIIGGHTNITGINGAGKTSFLNLIPIFFGATPNSLMEKAANKKNFVDYYLPSNRSMVIYEYLSHSGTKCVVLYRNNNQGRHNYRFVDGSAEDTLLTDDCLEILGISQNVKDVFNNIYKTGNDISRQIDNISDYIYILTADKMRLNGDRNLRDLCNIYSLSGTKQQLKFLSNLTQVTINQNNVVSNFKTMLIEAYLDNERIKTKPTSTADWLATINDVKALQSLQTEKQEIINGIQLKDAVLNSFNILHSYLDTVHVHTEKYQAKESTLRYELEAFQNNGNEKVRNLNNDVIQLSEFISEKEKVATKLKNTIQRIELAEKRYQEMNISVKEQEYIKRSEYFRAIDDAKRAKDLLVKSFENITREFDKFKADLIGENLSVIEAIKIESDEIQTLINRLRERYDHDLGKIEIQHKTQLLALDQEISTERQKLLDIQSEANERMYKASLFTNEDKTLLQHLKLAYEVKENSIADKSEQIKQTQIKIKQLNSDQLAAQSNLNALKNKLEKAKQQENQLRNSLFQKDSLLRFLHDSPNESIDWRSSIAKVINPRLLFSNNLSPNWSSKRDANILSLYGLEIDLDKLDIPSEADSIEQLQSRLVEAETYSVEFSKQYEKQSHIAQSLHRNINECNIKLVQLENELNTLKNERLQAKQLYDQTENDLKTKKESASQMEQELVKKARVDIEHFNSVVEPQKRKELHQAIAREKEGIKRNYVGEYDQLSERLKFVSSKEENAKKNHQQKMNALTNSYHRKLSDQGLDENDLRQADVRIRSAEQQYNKVKGYETILSEYATWKKNEYEYKQTYIKDLNETAKHISEGNYNLTKLKDMVSQIRTELRRKNDSMRDQITELERKIDTLNTQFKEITQLMDSDVLVSKVTIPEYINHENFIRNLKMSKETHTKQMSQLRTQVNSSKALLRRYEAFSLFKLFEEKIESLVQPSDALLMINTMSIIESIIDHDLPKKHDAVTNIFRNKSAQLRNYIQEILNLNKRLKSVSTELSNYLNRSNKFTAFSDFSMSLQSVLTDKNILDQLSQFVAQCEDYQSFDNIQNDTIPSEEFIRCCEYTLKVIESTKGHTDDIRSMVRLQMSVMISGRFVEIRTDSDFTNAGSTGMSRILVLVMFLALSRKLCPDDSVYIHIPLDEIGNFDAINTNLLFEMMEHNKIHLVCAQPENSTSNHKFKKLYIVGAEGVSSVVPMKIKEANPLLNDLSV